MLLVLLSSFSVMHKLPTFVQVLVYCSKCTPRMHTHRLSVRTSVLPWTVYPSSFQLPVCPGYFRLVAVYYGQNSAELKWYYRRLWVYTQSQLHAPASRQWHHTLVILLSSLSVMHKFQFQLEQLRMHRLWGYHKPPRPTDRRSLGTSNFHAQASGFQFHFAQML